MWEQGPSKGTRGKCRRACPDGEVLAVGVVMVTCDGDKNTSEHTEEVEKGGLMLPLHVRQDRLGYRNVRSHSTSAERLTEWGLPALAFLEYRAIGPWGPTESF